MTRNRPLAYWLLRFLPRNHLSYLIGRLAYIPLPRFLSTPMIALFARSYGIDLKEAEKPIPEYSSIGAFFVRNLKAGIRPIGEGLVSPVDGVLREAGPIRAGEIPQVKGRSYQVEEFLVDDSLAEQYRDGTFLSYYLSPTDYHHVHSPCSGKIVRSIAIPGTLWPVNDWSLNSIDDLFSKNERMVTVIETSRGPLTLVMVGATNVGKIAVEYDPYVSNSLRRLVPWSKKEPRNRRYPDGVEIAAGERLGTFYLGSTVVLLLPEGWTPPVAPVTTSERVRYGESVRLRGAQRPGQTVRSHG